MLQNSILHFVLAIAAALGGVLLFSAISFPSAPLTGSAAGMTVAGLLGLRLSMPAVLRNTIFAILGLNIGSAVTPEMLRAAVEWPFSIALLAVALVCAMSLSQFGLTRFFKYDRLSAGLASAPGHLSFVLGLASDSKSDVTAIAIIQSMRVLFLTLCVPVLVTVLFGATGVHVMPSGTTSLPALIGLGVASVLLGMVFTRLRVPAAFLLSGMVVSMIGHATNLTPGKVPGLLVPLALIGMGMLIGSRFSGVRWPELRAALGAGLWVTLANVAVTLVAVTVAYFVLGTPVALAIVAFAPGGVEAMAAIALALGLDPAFVAAHHVARLMLLTLLIPWLLAGARPKS